MFSSQMEKEWTAVAFDVASPKLARALDLVLFFIRLLPPFPLYKAVLPNLVILTT